MSNLNRRVSEMLFSVLSSFLSTVVYAIRRQFYGEAPKGERQHPLAVDCPVHGKTWLSQSGRTACCASAQYVPSGRVVSRRVSGHNAEWRRTPKTIILGEKGLLIRPEGMLNDV